MTVNTTVRGGLIRLAAGPVAAIAIVGAAVGLAAVSHASTSGSSVNPSNPIGTFATQERGDTQGGTQGFAHGSATTATSVEHGTSGPGPSGHGAGEGE